MCDFMNFGVSRKRFVSHHALSYFASIRAKCLSRDSPLMKSFEFLFATAGISSPMGRCDRFVGTRHLAEQLRQFSLRPPTAHWGRQLGTRL